MAPLVKTLPAQPALEVKVCVTAQHRQMLDQMLSLFDIQPDYDLNLMKPGQDLYDITSGVLTGLKPVLSEWRPDAVLVHGDTPTTFAAILAAFYQRIPLGRVEAGLLLSNIKAYEAMAFAHNPQGDGFACERIVQTLLADKSLFPLAPEGSAGPNPLNLFQFLPGVPCPQPPNRPPICWPWPSVSHMPAAGR